MESYRNRQWLIKKYVEEDLTKKEIAFLCGVSSRTIRWWFEKFGIKKGRKVNSGMKFLLKHDLNPYKD